MFEKELILTGSDQEEKFLLLTKEFTERTKWYEEPITSARIIKKTVEVDTENGKKSSERLHLKSNGEYIFNSSGKASLPARAGIGGTTISQLNDDDWAKVLNTCFPYKTGNMILNELEGEVYAAHSEQYAIIDIDDVFSTAHQILHARFPHIVFLGGTISPEFAACEYSLAHEEEIVKIYESALGEAFSKSTRLVAPTLRICTSNTSDSGVNIYPCLKCKGEDGSLYTITAGKPLCAIHKGDNGIKKVRENIEMSFDMFKKSAEEFVRMTYIKVNYPKQCFLNIAKRLSMPKPVALEIAEEIGQIFDGGKTTTAKFIYLSLTRILEKTIKKSERDVWEMTNQIAHAMSLDFKLYDTKSCEWLKSEKYVNQVSLFA